MLPVLLLLLAAPPAAGPAGLPLQEDAAQAPATPPPTGPPPFLGPWRAELELPGAVAPFRLEFDETDGVLSARVVNGPERITVPEVGWVRGEGGGPLLRLGFPHYDSELLATVAEDGRAMTGEYRRRRAADLWIVLPFRAVAGAADRFPRLENAPADALPPQGLTGRWRVTFEGDPRPAVAEFRVRPDGFALGTFLTSLGDWRFLAGRADPAASGAVRAGRLRLSAFDGAHVLVVAARLAPDGTLTGETHWASGATDAWTAVRDPDAELPDPFGLTRVREERPDLGALRYLDLEGESVSLAEVAPDGAPRMLVLFGTWCPNCNDEAVLLQEFDARYGPRGLRIVGLGFERSGEPEHDLEMLRRHRDRFGLRFPLLLAGRADEAETARAFPALSEVVAFPTTVFMDAAGRIRAVHTGFLGPATGVAHERLRADYERLVEGLLAESGG